MKRLAPLIFGISYCFILAVAPLRSQAQLLKRIKQEVKNRTADKAVRETGNATEKVLNKVGNASNGKEGDDETSPNEEIANDKTPADYSSYDFVPGDKIIFQPDLSLEPDSELPARFELQKGNAEIQSYEGEKFLHLDEGGYIAISPLMNSGSYLPKQFTVEFDMMYENNKSYFDQVNDFTVEFYTGKDTNYEGYGLFKFTIRSNEKVILGPSGAGEQHFPEALKKAIQTNDTWHHIALYVRENVTKAYINQYRVAASNKMPLGANKLAVRTDGRYGFKIKNFRIAAGGDDKYNQIVTDGKFITHGILFDVGESVLKPESMGAINEVAQLMKEHSDLAFEVDGHTDSDGNADANFKLSESRAEAVKAKLIALGIDEERLTAKGFGDTNPIDANDNAEGKANNRRVEFVKI